MASGADPSITFGVVDSATLLSMSGKAFLEAIANGDLPQPPIAKTLGFKLVEVGDGLAVFEGTPDASCFNPIGTIHGGFAATLLDSCLACSVHSTVPQGSIYTTLEIKVHYTRAILPDVGLMRAEGRVLHAGRTTGTSEGRLTDRNGKLYAHGTTTCLIMKP
ncbi:MAG: PaaI family thioesterase [Pseudomonadota bacterium]